MRAAGLQPDAWQRDFLLDDAQRALLLCGRQSGKSTVTAALAAFEAIFNPGSLVLLLSPSLRQSSELFRKFLDFFRAVPDAPKPIGDSALRMELANGSRVISLPGSEETIRGYSKVALLLVDEASRVPDGLYFSVRPMLAVSAGRLVAMSTPWGKRGWFYEAWRSSDPWSRVKVTARDNPRITPAFLEEERRSMPAAWFAAEYMAEFTDAEGGVFREEDIQRALSPTVQPLFASTPSLLFTDTPYEWEP